MKKLSLLLVMVISLIFLISCVDKEMPVKIPQVGDKAPDFTLENIDGKSISLSDFRGETVLLVFDSILCESSGKQIPHIKAAYEQSSGDLIVLYVYRDSCNLVKDHVASNQLTDFFALIDRDVTQHFEITNLEPPIATLYGVESWTPASFIIDTKGIIRANKIGVFESQEEIKNILKSL
jgi:peroxiredoxin